MWRAPGGPGSLPRMPRSSRARALAVGALLLALLVAAAAAVLASDGSAERPGGAVAIDRYLEAWASGDDDRAAALTDRPQSARRALRKSRAGLDGARVRARALDRRDDERGSVARVRVEWEVPRFGAFGYDVRIAATPVDDGWRVRWREAAVHPVLEADTRLGTAVGWPRRGAVLDRDGRPLVTERPVVDVAV